MSELCGECRHWRGLNDAWAGKGECRRFPPPGNLKNSRGDQAWPQTLDRDWCGEFKERPGFHG